MPRHYRTFGVATTAICLMVGALGAPSVARAAVTRHVPADYATIQAAITAAAPGDTVLVAAGSYAERLTINKSITVESADGPATTILDGNHGGSVVKMSLPGAETPVLRGFTIQHGGGNNDSGGGVANDGGAPLIEGNVIVDNTACGEGGGISTRFSAATIKDNHIARNSQAGCSGGSGGGGVFIGGEGTVKLLGNVIVDNSFDNGGGVSLNAAGSPTIDGNVISGNSGGDGGGIRMINHSDALVTNNLIVDNSANQGGGIAWSVPSGSTGPTVINNTIAWNTASTGAGVFAEGFDTGAQLVNNVIVGSTSQTTVYCTMNYDASPPQIAYNDVWNDVGAESAGSCAGFIGSNGNVSVDPMFVDLAGGDFHLRPDSPIIDTGRNSGAPAVDLDGDLRPDDGDEDGTATVDPGYDEATDPLLVDPARTDFGSVLLGIVDTPTVFTLTNHGSGPLTISTASIAGTNAGDFSVAAQTCTSGPLSVGSSCTITVGFKPLGLGSREADLVVTGPGVVGTRTIDLAGTGLDPVLVAPATLDFGSSPLGVAVTPASVTLSNQGGTSLAVSTVSLSGPNAGDFSVTAQSCTTQLVGGGLSCSITVGFTPGGLGARTATLSIIGPSPVGTRTVALYGDGTAPASGVGWGTITSAGGYYTWNGGGALARTVQSGTQRLHLAYATDRIGTKWASDSGPYAGVYYIGSTTGATWSKPTRLSTTNQHAARLALAASGSRVYAAWVTQTKFVNFGPNAPRDLYIRVNTNHGGSTSWRSAVKLSKSDRVDYPSIAASGNDVHVAYTDSETGYVRVATSRNLGVTWKQNAWGTTTIATTSGKTGLPSIAVDGGTVALVWIADVAGTVKARISLDHGTTWGSIVTVGTGSIGLANVAVKGGRVAFVWTTADQVVVRQRLSGAWGAPLVIASLAPGADTVPYAPAVLLRDTTRIGVAWSAELDTPGYSELRWAESANNGGQWYEAQTIGSAVSTSTRRANDWASVIWPSSGSRYAVWNGYTLGSSSYHLYFRKGTGTPIGSTTAATVWMPSTVDPAAPTDLGPSRVTPHER